MTLNVEEQHAIAGGLIASGVPTLINEMGLDNLIVEVGDVVFEGDAGSAAFVTGIGFTAVALTAFAMVVFTDIDGWVGVTLAGVGAAMLGVALQSFAQTT